jgi:hypothetical protein
MQSLFLIDRGQPGPDFTPGPTWRRVVIADSSRTARRLAGDTADGCTVWQNFGRHNQQKGLLLVRWMGLDVDYGTSFHPSVLPGGMPTGFHHRDNRHTWGLFQGATWWSSHRMPKWLERAGVLLPTEQGPASALVLAIADDEAAAVARVTGNRPFGFRAVPGWQALARSPGFRAAWLPGIEFANMNL